MMTPRVQELTQIWLTQIRPADPSPYVFPGQLGGHISTATIRLAFHGLCSAAGLTGKEFHPHALRHSYAHILLESVAIHLRLCRNCSITPALRQLNNFTSRKILYKSTNALIFHGLLGSKIRTKRKNCQVSFKILPTKKTKASVIRNESLHS